ncbi:hypothetical protein FALCPG4_018595 [Fusarium falciforme]
MADSESQLRRVLAYRPHRSKKDDAFVRDLRRCTEAIYSALQVGTASIILDIDQRTAVDRLPASEGASFDSHAEDHKPICLPNTRVELLDHISRWIDDPDAETIFWLKGMAGTGKSTISRTVARKRFETGDLGASFFFKRGETDRGNLAKFVPTLARQLAANVPAFAPHINNAIEADSAIIGKTVREQFDKLILGPLSKIPQASWNASSLVIIIDALDECERDADISLLVDLLSHAQTPQLPRLRMFVTSRLEVATRLGFYDINGTYRNLVLHAIPAPLIKHDISTFLYHELGKARDDFNLSVEEERKLPSNWPGESSLQTLVEMAAPLFIFAATTCRFINDRRYGNPNKQLGKVLSGKSHHSKLDMSYAPILNQQLDGVSEDDKEQVLEEFRLVVGTIVTLASPLSASALSKMLDIPLETINNRLDMLHPVLNVPSNQESPVRLLHLSFRDYLVDSQKKAMNEFLVDEKLVNRDLAKHCLRIMRGSLRENICGIRIPGTRRSTIGSQCINERLPPELQYACLYWVHHRVAVDPRLDDTKEVYDFLTKHFLHWLETMSLMGRAMESLGMLKSLGDWLKNGQDPNLSGFVADAVRFAEMNFSVIDEAPLQIYSSALVFAPTKSVVRRTFEREIPRWLSRLPLVKEYWDACLSTLEGHTDLVTSVVFSHDSKLVASASSDATVRIWSMETGKCEQVLKGHSGSVNWVVFSHDSKLVASASYTMVRIWKVETGKCKCVLEDDYRVGSVVFSHDSRLVASASSNKTVRIWSVETGKCEKVLEGHSLSLLSVVFSYDSKLIASASLDTTVRIWSVETGKCEKVLEGHSSYVNSAVFSHDSKLVASGSLDKTVRIWSVETGKCEQVLEGHSLSVQSVAFSHDSKLVASASLGKTVRIWSVETGKCEQVLDGHSDSVKSVVFSHNSRLVASASSDKTVRIWSVETGKCEQVLEGHSYSVTSVVFSHDSKLVASGSLDKTVRIWSVETRKCERVVESHSDSVKSVVFSHNSELVASGSDDRTVRIWSVKAGKCEQVLDGHSDSVKSVVFSHNSELVASASYDMTVRIWSVETGKCEQVLDGHSDWVISAVFSHDSKLIASASYDMTVRIWSVETGKCEQVLEGHSDSVKSVVFSHDSKLVASSSYDKTVRIWRVETSNCDRVVNLGLVAPGLYFQNGDTCVVIEAGIPLGHETTPSGASLFSSSDHSLSDLSKKDQAAWIRWHGHNLLCLPPECRNGQLVISGSSVVIGCNSGRVMILTFSPTDVVERMLATGTDTNAPTGSSYGYTALHAVAGGAHSEVSPGLYPESETRSNDDHGNHHDDKSDYQDWEDGVNMSHPVVRTGFPSTLPELVDTVFHTFSPILEPAVPLGKTRIRWKCRCGENLFDDFVEVKPGSLEALQARLREMNGTQYSNQERNNSAWQQVQILCGLLNHISAWIRHGVMHMVAIGDQNANSLPLHSLNQHSQQESMQNQRVLHLLLCIDKGETLTRLYQERLQGVSGDAELFLFLRYQYYKHRKFASWFTLRSVRNLSLARFKVDANCFASVHSHDYACTSQCVCLPPVELVDENENEYRCKPAPRVQPDYFPAIGSRELTHYFLKPHTFDVPQRTLFNQIPKRACGQLRASQDEAQLGWGLHFQEGWHWRTIYFVVVVLLVTGSLVFGVTWSVLKRDIQGAFAIAGTWLALGPLLLGYIAVRDI